MPTLTSSVHRPNLHDLPTPLLELILLFSANSALVTVSRSCYNALAFSSAARASFLFARHYQEPACGSFLAECSHWHICTPEVIRILLNRCREIDASLPALRDAVVVAAWAGRVDLVAELLALGQRVCSWKWDGEDARDGCEDAFAHGGQQSVSPRQVRLTYPIVLEQGFRAGLSHIPVIRYLVEEERAIVTSFILMRAVEYGNSEVISYLASNITHGRNRVMCAAGARAATLGNVPTLSLLMKHGLDLRAQDNVVLYSGIQSGHPHVVEFLLKKGGLCPNTIFRETHESALVVAAAADNVAVCATLVEAGADVRYQAGLALAVAAKEGRLSNVIYLCESAGADIWANGGEAMRLARINGHKDVVTYLTTQSSNSREDIV
ncbi:hypothetical protein SpCBS45565_g00713 [Spizellomyces sp. 'palustris']|nr:hypothetical protein SpCBS45565_g00713 [Spizellomyces sp. 'palustris']